jgi:hypothetical protein
MTTYQHTLLNPSFVNSATGRKMPNDTGWQTRHMAALRTPTGFEVAIVEMLKAWALYADTHSRRYESKIGHDVLGDEWAAIGRGIRGLLNGETGHLDCGTLDGFIADTLAAEGCHES